MTGVTPNAPSLHNLWITISAGLQRRMLGAITWYQVQRTGLPSPCRFFPSCSEYAHDAISVHGPVRGGWLTLRRLARCRPFGASGYDPIPPAHAACQAAHHEHHDQESEHV